MRLTHPRMQRVNPQFAGVYLRRWPQFIHASLMVVDVEQVGRWSRRPFQTEPMGTSHYEPYHAATELVRSRQSDGVLALDSAHTAYGLGQIYRYQGQPLAYHNWYSGRVYGQQGRMDGASTLTGCVARRPAFWPTIGPTGSI